MIATSPEGKWWAHAAAQRQKGTLPLLLEGIGAARLGPSGEVLEASPPEAKPLLEAYLKDEAEVLQNRWNGLAISITVLSSGRLALYDVGGNLISIQEEPPTLPQLLEARETGRKRREETRRRIEEMRRTEPKAVEGGLDSFFGGGVRR